MTLVLRSKGFYSYMVGKRPISQQGDELHAHLQKDEGIDDGSCLVS